MGGGGRVVAQPGRTQGRAPLPHRGCRRPGPYAVLAGGPDSARASHMSLFGHRNQWLSEWLDRMLPTVRVEVKEEQPSDRELVGV